MTEPRIVMNGARLVALTARAGGVDVALTHARVYVTTPTGDAEWTFEATLRLGGVTRIEAGVADGALFAEEETIRDAALAPRASEGGGAEAEPLSIVESGTELAVVRVTLGLVPSGATLTVQASTAQVILGRGHRVSEAPPGAAPPA